MDIEDIRKKAISEINGAVSVGELEAAKIKYLGRKQGKITVLLKALKNFSLEERKKIGPMAQKLREEIGEAIVFRGSQFASVGKPFDMTLPGEKIDAGHLNLISQTEDEIRRIFNSMNFSVIDGPEVEEEYYNFDALNIPKDHPAREMWDTFWVKTEDRNRLSSAKGYGGASKKKYLLRTHTSPVQIRYMECHQPPFQIISPGRVFRYEATDATHETNFNQVEGLMIGKDVSLANFKFVISEFFRQFFSSKTVQVRFRSSYFPFVEPGVEVDLKLDGSKWLEMGGAGMVHPKVLKCAGYDPKEWQGFAFGFGVERLAMVKYGIPDMRLFMSGDLRFIKKF